MSEISVKKFGRPVTVQLDEAGCAICFCGCEGLLVEVEPGTFMCPDWAFTHALQQEWLRSLQSVLAAKEDQYAAEHIYGNRSGEPRGLLSALSSPTPWSSESELRFPWADVRRALDLREFLPPVDWDATLRAMAPAGWPA